MSDLIRGKVAKILNSREVAINIGKTAGVRTGMQFDILDQATQNILDPDSEEVIGSVNRPKVRVRVEVVDERFSIAQTFRTYQVNIGGHGKDLFSAQRMLGIDFAPPNWVTKKETLKTTESTWEDLDERDSYVSTGDIVVQVLNPSGSE